MAVTPQLLTRGQERCLYVFPMDEFVRVAESIRQAPVTSKAARDYARVFLSGASDEIPDKQGRVTIPATLREYAGLSRDCTVIGAGSRVEVWTVPSSTPLAAGSPSKKLTLTPLDATSEPPLPIRAVIPSEPGQAD